MDQPKIIIIGAGLAGLSAAQRLITKGLNNVHIIEAKNRIGGRVLTQEHGGSYIEIGAQWIHGEGSNPIYRIAHENGLLKKELREDHKNDEGDLFYTQHGQLAPIELVEDTDGILDDILEEANKFSRQNVPADKWDDSLGQYAREMFLRSGTMTGRGSSVQQIIEAIFNWKMALEKTENGCPSPDELSLYAWGQYLEYEGDDSVVLEHGYEPIIRVLAADIPEECLHLNKEVETIKWTSSTEDVPDAGNNAVVSPLVVGLGDGETQTADYVIFTCSLGILKSRAASMFIPPLPEDKTAAIDRMGFGTVNKIFLEYERPFWDKDCMDIELLWLPDKQPFFLNCLNNKHIEKYGEWYRSIHGFDVVDHHSNLLCGWIAGSEANVMEQIDDDVVIDVCHELLMRFTGVNDMSRPNKLIRSCWSSDPHVLGSYTYIKAGNTAGDCDVLSEALPSTQNPRLLFAGEATVKAYFSTTHGALLSGQREAWIV